MLDVCDFHNWRENTNTKITISFTATAILYCAIFYLAYNVKEKPLDAYLNYTILILAIALGWLFGVILAPYSQEVEKFAEYGQGISLFLSGYFISKFDIVISKIATPETLFAQVAGFRVASSVSIFLITLIITYVARTYRW